MKKIIAILLFALTQIAFAWCGVETTIKVNFMDSTIWFNKYSFSSGCLAVVNDTLSETLPDGYKCNKAFSGLEKTFLDSNVTIKRGRFLGVQYIDIYVLSLATHELGDVFKDEFLHWQQCGMLNLTYEEADSLVTPLAKAINENFDNEPDNLYESDIFRSTGITGSLPYQVSQWEKAACSVTAIKRQTRQSRAEITFKNGWVHTPKSKQGEVYYIFDLNGKIIQQGSAKENIRIPSAASILRIGNSAPVLLK